MRVGILRGAGSAALGLAAMTALAPMSLLVMNAFKTQNEIVSNPLALPTHPHWQNFTTAWQEGGFSLGLFNSLLLSGCTVTITVATAALAAYPLARRRTRMWKLVALYFLACVTVPVQLFLFPLYFAYAALGLVGNLLATSCILSAINLPLAVLLLRASIIGIPTDLDDAARIDGAGEWETFRYVIMPLIRSGMITVGIIVLLNSWNEFLVTSTFQQGARAFTMTLGYRALNGSIIDDQGLLMAGALIIIAPVLIVFLLMQRYFVAGLISGAIKG